ncbi:MAG: ATP-binding protein [Candidatus Kapabacteria bacterium]|jgi:signal transduction histidine kinase|nr:ATP-binding protein [Candidatus Kapabacteria bacterium]
MAILHQNKQPFKPYARLINIIGDQLITDKKVAVIEVVKNCYDADAENVQVRFINMNENGQASLPEKNQPYIEIEDDGDGMTLDTIEKVWLRPATPNKLDKKKQKLNRTNKGRVIQGEKGIGRFAIHKLGEKIELFTKALGQNEIKLEMDFREFDPENGDLFSQPLGESKLLEDVNNTWYVNNPPEEIKKEKGTLIRIYCLRESWKAKDFKDLYKSIQRLIPPSDKNAERLDVEFKTDFKIDIYKDGERYSSGEVITFEDVIERAEFTMIGTVSKEGVLTFEYKSIAPARELKNKINLLNKEELANNNYVSYFIEKQFEPKERPPICGQFSFTFYAFDLSNRSDGLVLNQDIKKFIKDNYVYVLRDGLRVYPYGEPGIDWLNLDKLRGNIRAGEFISYNDLTGFVYISQEGNPLLKDSTNRQGIMDMGGVLSDFTDLVGAVTDIFNSEIKIDKQRGRITRNSAFKDSNERVLKSFNSLKLSLEKIDDVEILEKANKFLDTVQQHSTIMKNRMETVEDLAGLGMAVEKSSHDALTLLSKMRNNVKDFRLKAKNQDYKNEDVIALLDELDENLVFVYDEMQIIQPLFKNQRKTVKDVSVYEMVEKVVKYFRRDLEGKISVKIQKDNDVVVRTNTGLILQILINLLDNAIYWVNKNESKQKEIIIKLSSENSSLIIADNGSGVREDAIPLVFDEFFSLKSNGRGLGLYIVREILLRINGEIEVVKEDKDKVLSGANFIVKFNQEQ